LINHKESYKRETKYLDRGEIWCFTVNRRWVRDGPCRGNNARFINHACKPNCYSQIIGRTIWIRAGKNIKAGEELTYDYHTDATRSSSAGAGQGARPSSDAAMNTETDHPQSSQRTHRGFQSLVVFVTFVAIVLCALGNATGQGDPADSDLDRASGGRTVRVGNVESGRVTSVALEVYVARVLAAKASRARPMPPSRPRGGHPDIRAGQCRPASARRVRFLRHHALQVLRAANGGHASRGARHRGPGPDRRGQAGRGVLLGVLRRANGSCGGHLAWRELPYLRSVVDDVHDEDVPWTADLNLREIEGALRKPASPVTRLTGLSVDCEERVRAGDTVEDEGLEPGVMGRRSVSRRAGRDDRTQHRVHHHTELAAPSTCRQGIWPWSCLCVVGATRAQRGESFQDILATYYPGLQLTSSMLG